MILNRGFWKENSLALDNDDLIYIQSGCDGVPDAEKIRLKITNCSVKNTKVHYDLTMSLLKAEKILAMLTDVIEHAHKMNAIEKNKADE